MSDTTVEKLRDKAVEAIDTLADEAADLRENMGQIVKLCDDADDDNWQEKVEEIRGIAGNW